MGGDTVNGLRQRLREITENGLVDSHRQMIEELRLLYGHSIQLMTSSAPIARYTCAMYAFGLEEDKEYAAIVLASPAPVYASTRFVQRLIDRGTLKKLDVPEPETLVVYRLNGAVTHIGKMLSLERVESKWGIGHLYRHALLEVPAQYGDEIEYFDSIDVDTALDELANFARAHGVRFKGDTP